MLQYRLRCHPMIPNFNSSVKEDKENGLRGRKVAIANPMPATVMNHFFAITGIKTSFFHLKLGHLLVKPLLMRILVGKAPD